LHTLVSYIRLMLPFIYFILVMKCGNWRNWKKYYPSILFVICVDFFICILTYKYSLWEFQPSFLIPNHTTAEFLLVFTFLPAMALIYLSRYPFKLKWTIQFRYVMIWTLIYDVIEFIFVKARLIIYQHGWNYWWSCLVWLFIFIGLRLHHTKPLLAWALCFSCTIFLILFFHIPISKIK